MAKLIGRGDMVKRIGARGYGQADRADGIYVRRYGRGYMVKRIGMRGYGQADRIGARGYGQANRGERIWSIG